MECVLEVTQDVYKTYCSTKLRLFDINNDRQYVIEDAGQFELSDDVEWEEHEKEEDKALLFTTSDKELNEYLASKGASIKKVRFLWNF